jgi:hypothetical protein
MYLVSTVNLNIGWACKTKTMAQQHSRAPGSGSRTAGGHVLPVGVHAIGKVKHGSQSLLKFTLNIVFNQSALNYGHQVAVIIGHNESVGTTTPSAVSHKLMIPSPMVTICSIKCHKRSIFVFQQAHGYTLK